MKRSIKTSTALIVIFAVAVLLGGGALACFYVYQPEGIDLEVQDSIVVKKTNSPAISDTADWKTYINAKHGYSIRVPQDYGELSTFDGNYSSSIISSDRDLINFGNLQVSERGNSFAIIVGSGEVDARIKDYRDNYDVTVTDVKVGKNQNIEAVKIISNKEKLPFKVDYLIVHNGNLYDVEDTQVGNSIVETVISTFQFTK